MKRVMFFSMILVGIIALMGCGSTDKLRNDVMQVRNAQPNKTTTAHRAQIIADHLLKMDEIEDCAVHISGRTAVIGVSLAADLEKRELIALKKKIIAEAKAVDPQTTHAAVSTSAGLYKKLDDLRQDTQEDKEIQQELEENSKNIPAIVVPSF